MSNSELSENGREQFAGPQYSLASADLPPNGIRRWTPMRKAEVVACVRAGLITPENACERYMLSEEELLSWGRYLNKYGVSALRATRVQDYRIRTGLGG